MAGEFKKSKIEKLQDKIKDPKTPAFMLPSLKQKLSNLTKTTKVGKATAASSGDTRFIKPIKLPRPPKDSGIAIPSGTSSLSPSEIGRQAASGWARDYIDAYKVLDEPGLGYKKGGQIKKSSKKPKGVRIALRGWGKAMGRGQ